MKDEIMSASRIYLLTWGLGGAFCCNIIREITSLAAIVSRLWLRVQVWCIQPLVPGLVRKHSEVREMMFSF